ncbi:amino acid ABC transporter ATP-binding protein [Natrialbaceae archaeon A-chndr2]
MTGVITARDVTQCYDTDPVFEGVDLSVQSGEVVALIGPSGVGKTSLLRLLALFEPPSDGTITYDGVDVWAASESQRLTCRRRLGMVFQDQSLFDASVRRNVEYGVHVRKPWPERLRRNVADFFGSKNGTGPAVDALAVVELEDAIDRSADSLSGGEAQRIAFARALAYEPDVLILDEPTSDLDPRNTDLIEQAVLEASRRDIGIVMATHDMNQAKRIADRVGVLLDDGIIELGPTNQIFEHPRDDRTRQFIDGELIY